MLPSVRDVLALPSVQRGRPFVRAGDSGLSRPVRWVHVAEVADIAHLLDGGELILTTGIALPDTAAGLRRYIDELRAVRASALVIELIRRFGTRLPDELVDAAAHADLPLVELHRETPFVAITQAVHTLILDARDQEGLDRQTHRTLLTALLSASPAPSDTAERARALQVPFERRALTGVVIQIVDEHADAAVLRDLGAQAATVLHELDVPALVGLLDDERVATLLSTDRGTDHQAIERTLVRLAERMHSVAHRRGSAVVIGAGGTTSGNTAAAVTGARQSLHEAVQVADTAHALPGDRAYYRPPDLRLRGLVHAVREQPAVREFVARELGQLLEHDTHHGTRLVEFVSALCRAGGNKTAAAQELFISRAALYDRITKVQQLLGVDLGDPEVVLSLHFAVLAHETLERPDLAVS